MLEFLLHLSPPFSLFNVTRTAPQLREHSSFSQTIIILSYVNIHLLNDDLHLFHIISDRKWSSSNIGNMKKKLENWVFFCLALAKLDCFSSVRTSQTLFRSCQEERWLFDVLGHSEGCRTNIRNTEMESCRAKTLHRTSISWWQRQTGGTRLPFMPNIGCVWMNLSGPYVTLMMSTPVAATCFANLFSAARALCNKNKRT